MRPSRTISDTQHFISWRTFKVYGSWKSCTMTRKTWRWLHGSSRAAVSADRSTPQSRQVISSRSTRDCRGGEHVLEHLAQRPVRA